MTVMTYPYHHNLTKVTKILTKKRVFRKIFFSILIFLELQCLVDDLVNFSELPMFINASLP